MKKPIFISWTVLLVVGTSSSALCQSLPAFPGAEGPGADASGGRIGDVYHVTNLQDYHPNGTDPPVPGSLRYGLETAPPAGRTIVFDVGGTLNLVPDVHQSTHTWLRSGKGNITLAGQTAPGPGITIAGQGGKLSGNNWILRHLKFRPGPDQTRPGVLTNDGISNNLQNSIIDHVSISWADDEALSTTDAVTNTTVQYSILGEGQNYPLDDGTSHAFGAIISSEVDDARLSYHHNLFIHNRSRNPRLGSENGTGAVLNFSNNVVYNWSGWAGYSFDKPSRTNYLSNYYIAGSNTASSDIVFYSPDTQTQIYHEFGNRVDMNKNGAIDGSVFAFNGPQFQGTAAVFTRTPFDVTSGHVQSADDAVGQVLDYVGAQWWDRDPVDQRLTSDLANGTGSFIDYVTDAPQDPNYSYDSDGYPIYGVTQRPANFDTDGDGMPDTWEAAHGLNNNVADNSGDFDADGYTNLEEYLNDLGTFPASTTIGWIGGSGRYEEIENWGISQTVPVGSFTNWQPSRFDEAEIKSGNATLDSVGQQASVLRVAPDNGDVASLTISSGWLEAPGAVEIASSGTGQLHLSGGELRVGTLSKGPGGSFSFTGGMLAAIAVDFNLVNEGGTIAPGQSGGTTAVSGDLTLSGGSLRIEVGDSGNCQLTVTGSAALGGMLDVSLLPGATLGPGQSFEIMDVGGLLDGAFLGLMEGGLVGNFGENLYITYVGGDGNDVVLFTRSGLAGDFNGDGVVDAVDYAVWRENLGTSFALNGNGDEAGGSANLVDAADYSVWVSNYGQTPSGRIGGDASQNVPEPVAAICLAVAMAGVSLTRRFRRQDHRLLGPFLAVVTLVGSIILQGTASHAAPATASESKMGWEMAPEILSRIVPPKFPPRVFDIIDYGAVEGGSVKCSEAFKKAVAACVETGGGRVVVPAGKFLTGPIRLRSDVELHLTEGAEVVFSDQFEDYLPVVLVRVGGVELYNYSPLIYARDCTNIAITGPGRLNGNARAWWKWQKNETRRGFEMGAAGVPVEERVFGTSEAAIRPSFISFVNCSNILLEQFTIGSGPNWTIHPIYCNNTTIRGVSVVTDGPNNDGIDPDSCTDMLIENCMFDTGDDCVVLKSGYNQDGWRVGRPTENVIMRKCTSKKLSENVASIFSEVN